MQVIPHVTDEIQEWIERVAQISVDGQPDPPDVCIIELGGTVGDIESMPFIEALRQFQWRVGSRTSASSTSRSCPSWAPWASRKRNLRKSALAVCKTLALPASHRLQKHRWPSSNFRARGFIYICLEQRSR